MPHKRPTVQGRAMTTENRGLSERSTPHHEMRPSSTTQSRFVHALGGYRVILSGRTVLWPTLAASRLQLAPRPVSAKAVALTLMVPPPCHRPWEREAPPLSGSATAIR